MNIRYSKGGIKGTRVNPIPDVVKKKRINQNNYSNDNNNFNAINTNNNKAANINKTNEAGNTELLY